MGAAPPWNNMMSRLLILVEGITEESFVNNILASHLYNYGYSEVSAKLLGDSRMNKNRGGIRSWPSARKDIIKHLKADKKRLITTMVDYYALPSTGDKSWPGRGEASRLLFSEKSNRVQQAILQDIERELGPDFYPPRFLPYVVMHEFEGLLFSDCKAFGESIGHPELVESLTNVRRQFETPEEINDSRLTAPSKRVEAIIQGYRKPRMGTLAIQSIGLATVRQECHFFNEWLEKLEQWPQQTISITN